MYDTKIRDEVIELFNSGNYSKNRLSKDFNIPRRTIQDWCLGRFKKNKNHYDNFEITSFLSQQSEEWKRAYCYILGEYLGDGYICLVKKTYRLRIFNDSKYIKMSEYIKSQLKIIFPKNKVTAVKQKKQTV